MRPLLVILMAASLVTVDALAKTPQDKAEALHKQALAHAREGRWEPAFQLWEAAEALHGDWRYAFNQASGHAHMERWAQAWYAVDRANAYGVPADRKPIVEKLQVQVEGELSAEHGLIALNVTVDDVVVTLDGEPWAPPYKRWTTRTQSALRVTKPGYRPFAFEWQHASGGKHSLVVSLQPEAAGVEPAPAPAPAPVTVVRAAPARSSGAFKWVMLTSCVALAAGGVALHAAAIGSRDEANRNADPAFGLTNRRQRYDDAVSDMTARGIAAYALYGLAAGAAGVSIWLFVANDRPSFLFAPTALRDDGAGIVWHARF